MEREWSVRKYQSGDLQQVLALYKTVHGRVRTEDYWKWQYENRPFGVATIWIAATEGQIISHTAYVGSLLRVDGKPVHSAWAGDAMTHPDYRRQGAWEAAVRAGLEDLKSQGVPFEYAHIQNLRSYPGAMKVGAVHVGELPELRKICNWRNVLEKRTKLRYAGRIVGGMMSRIERDPRIARHLSSVQIERVSSFGSNINECCSRAADIARVIVARDREYLNWRYFQRPGYEYAAYVAERSGEALGYIVLRHVPEELMRGYILDLLALPGEEDVAQLLIGRAMEHFAYEKVDTIHCWMMEHSPYYSMFRRAGFARVRREVQSVLIARAIDQAWEPIAFKPTNWYFCMGDQEDGY